MGIAPGRVALDLATSASGDSLAIEDTRLFIEL